MRLAPGDFVVDKMYLLTLLSEQFKGETLKVKHRTGHLWNRLCSQYEKVFNPECPLCIRQQRSWPKPPLYHWTTHNDAMLFSARDILSNRDAFLAHSRRKVGNASREDFKLLCAAIEQQLNQG